MKTIKKQNACNEGVKAEGENDLSATVPQLVHGPTLAKSLNAPSPAAGTAAATSENGEESVESKPPQPKKRTKSEAGRDRWRKVREGLLRHPDQHPPRAGNPLFALPEEERAKLFAWLRECPYDDAVRQMLRDRKLPEATSAELSEFFQMEAELHWEKRLGRAAQEADALVRLAEKSPVRFSAGILAALGQEAFRQIASGAVEPEAMGKLANLFLKARSDERMDQMQELKREKLRRDLQGQIDQALERLAQEVEKHPEARKAFEALQQELATTMENAEERL